MTKNSYRPPRYYRMLTSRVVYWCPVRGVNALAFKQWGHNVWLDAAWVEEEEWTIPAIGGYGAAKDSDLELVGDDIMLRINNHILANHAYIEPLIDQSRDEFDIRYGIGSYEVSVSAARRAWRQNNT